MAKATCDHCCCCIELRKGCLIIGYLDLIGFTGIVIKLIELWTGVGPLLELFKELLKPKITDEDLEDMGKVMRALVIGIIVVCLILSALKIFFNVILLIGLHKNKRGHVGAYLIYSAIFLFIFIIFLIIGIVKFATIDNTELGPLTGEYEAIIYTQFIVFTFSCVLIIYFWLVIRSQYHQMPIHRPKRFTNPMEAEGLTTVNLQHRRPNHLNDDTRSSNETHPQCASQEIQEIYVRLEGPATMLNNEGSLGNELDGSRGSVALGAVSESSTAVLPEGPKETSQDSEGSQSTANDSGQLTPVVVIPTSDERHSFAVSTSKMANDEIGDIELVPVGTE